MTLEGTDQAFTRWKNQWCLMKLHVGRYGVAHCGLARGVVHGVVEGCAWVVAHTMRETLKCSNLFYMLMKPKNSCCRSFSFTMVSHPIVSRYAHEVRIIMGSFNARSLPETRLSFTRFRYHSPVNPDPTPIQLSSAG